MKATATILIGNSDDKLTQRVWCKYCEDLYSIATMYAIPVHFWGHSQPVSKYQTACIVFEMETAEFDSLKDDLKTLAENYLQDSIAIVVGMTEFITQRTDAK